MAYYGDTRKIEGGTGLNIPKLWEESVKSMYEPQKQFAEIQKLQGEALKNKMMGQLLGSVMGQGGESTSGDNNNPSGGNGLGISKEELTRALLGLNAQSPQQQQSRAIDLANLRKTNNVEASKSREANKRNLSVGSANEIREYITPLTTLPQGYQGNDAHAQIAGDLIKYKTTGDKAAKARLVQLGLANKLKAEATSYSLKSQAIPTTVPAQQEQEKAITQGWPIGTSHIASHLPGDIQTEVNKLFSHHSNTIAEKNKAYNQRFSGEQPTAAPESNERQSTKKYKWSDINAAAKKYNHSQNEVIDNLAKQAGMTPEEFMTKYVDLGSQ